MENGREGDGGKMEIRLRRQTTETGEEEDILLKKISN